MRKKAAETDPHTLRLHTRERNTEATLKKAVKEAMQKATETSA